MPIVAVPRSSSSQDEPEPHPGVQPMKSAGSVGHPDSCKAGAPDVGIKRV